ncbi:GNAT family N-acetyltransferase [Paraburkholderia sp. LEh10]|uniref:GNAT family N-acetyltransferase n=1 Tax=Paraburkholderia sp. LEh10 TaxID=2821353 RepID=UPI001AEAD806|nr:GNAT family N-acetyltransferase [Paraburkholderia sp. LEh10]MBP0596147.1 GNAT family N-acetyltransferase [Paraburkholderia sp. LEh10]
MSVKLRLLSSADRATINHLTLHPEQEQFVSPFDLIFCKLRNSTCPEWVHPFSIVDCEQIIGFFVLREQAALPAWAPLGVVTLHSLRIDRSHQGNGYGRAAIELAAQWIQKNRPYSNRLMLGVNVRNTKAKEVYLKIGFRDTGATCCGSSGLQKILEYRITSNH